MRQLTFKGFLYQYVRALAKINTNDIRLLASEVHNNKRLVEPLVLYSLATNKPGCLQRNAKDEHLIQALQMFEGKKWNEVVSLLDSKDASLANEFHKVYRSYLTERDKQKAINHSKHLRLKRTKELQRIKGVTTYRLYTDLKLNHGNIHAYLKNDDVSKVSLNVADMILGYLETAKLPI